MDRQISLEVERGDALGIVCDVLVLKHARRSMASTLQSFRRSRPLECSRAAGAGQVAPLPAKAVLFVGVSELSRFDCAGIGEFAARTLSCMAGAHQPNASH